MDLIIRVSAIIFFTLLGFGIAIILHELGHLIGGLLSGYKFSSFRLLNLLWAKDENGKIKMKIGAGISGIAGQCLMEPCDNEKDFRFILYNLSGGLLNIITGFICICILFFSGNYYIILFLALVCYSSFFTGILNLIPHEEGGIPVDGKNVIVGKKSAEAKHSFYLMLKTNADMANGKLLPEFGNEIFLVNEDADVNNYFIAYTIITRSDQLQTLGLYDQSYTELKRLDASKIPEFYGAQVILGLIFHEIVYFGDEAFVQLARERLEEKKKHKLFQKILKMKHPAFMVFNAAITALLQNEPDKAREIIEQINKLTPTLQNPGQEHYISVLLTGLESRLGCVA